MKRGTLEHSKMRRLRKVLDLRLYEAAGLLETLWHLADRESPRGDIGKLSDEAICDSLDWARDHKTLLDALVDCGWIDRCEEHRLVVHDWHDHCNDATRKRIMRDGSGFAIVRQRRTTADNGGQRQPALPSPALPSLAPPSPTREAATTASVPASPPTMPAEPRGLDPRIEALMGVGMAFGNAGGLLRRFSPTEAEVENYVERSMSPGINNRIAFVTACIREKREIEAVQATGEQQRQADEDRAMREGIEDARRRLAAKGKQ